MSEPAELVTVVRRDRICIVTLNREPKLNAISAAMEGELCAALARPELRQAACVVFTGGPNVFSAGADLNELRGLDPAAIVAYFRATGDFAERVADLPQPTFSAICGYCLGGGLELALATDFRIAERDAVFGLPEVSLGILPSSGGTHRLVRLLGPAQTKELVLLRDRVTAPDAHALGLVTEVAEPGQALARSLELAQRLATLPELAVRVTGEVIDSMAEASRTAGLKLERLAYAMLAQTTEADQATAKRLAR
jgi:enoyl-CoA hydratase/carnithine racemase